MLCTLPHLVEQALMRGAVKEKRARHNLCYADFAQEPDYPAGKGRVVPFTELPWTARMREGIGRLVGAADVPACLWWCLGTSVYGPGLRPCERLGVGKRGAVGERGSDVSG